MMRDREMPVVVPGEVGRLRAGIDRLKKYLATIIPSAVAWMARAKQAEAREANLRGAIKSALREITDSREDALDILSEVESKLTAVLSAPAALVPVVPGEDALLKIAREAAFEADAGQHYRGSSEDRPAEHPAGLRPWYESGEFDQGASVQAALIAMRALLLQAGPVVPGEVERLRTPEEAKLRKAELDRDGYLNALRVANANVAERDARIAGLEAALAVAAEPVPVVPGELPDDLFSHAAAWLKALSIARDHAEVKPPDIDDRAYWEREIEAFRRTWTALRARLPQAGQADAAPSRKEVNNA